MIDVTNNIEYREAVRSDAPQIALLHAESWRRTYRGNFRDEYLDSDVVTDRQVVWAERLSASHPAQYVCVACADTAIVGFICAYGAQDPVWGSFVDNLHVAPEAQRRGVGAALMRRTGRWLSSRYPDIGVHLLVAQSNPARLFYERIGGRNAELLDVENPGGGTGRYFRYVWDRPSRLLASAA